MAFPTPSSPALSIKRLDHLGLVAGMCLEQDLARMIDSVIQHNEYHVSQGQALVAMILKGLGFHSLTLHMSPTSSPTSRPSD